MSDFRKEFPEYPADEMPTIPEGFTDRSWSNEPCPCFIHEASGVVLWVDYPDTADREYGADMARFQVQRCTNRSPEGGWQFDGGLLSLFETDDWETVLRSLPAYTDWSAGPHVVMYFVPSLGMRIYGPFPDGQSAADWGEDQGEGGEFVLPLYPQEGADLGWLYPGLITPENGK